MTTKREQSASAENNPGSVATSASSQEELKEQFVSQFSQLLQMAEKMGIDLRKELPPTGAEPVIEKQVELLPGTKVGDGPGASWIPWGKQHLDPNNKVPVMVQYYPDLVWQAPTEDGFWKIPVTVQGLRCWLTVGEVNMVDPMFAEVYEHAVEAHREAKKFRDYGPEYAPWSQVGKNKINTWFTSQASTFGMSIEGDTWDGQGIAPYLEKLTQVATAEPAE